MNIGLLGGTFDPPHIGHLILAESACDQLRVDIVLFVPNYISPFKQSQSSSSAELRAEMVELAIVGNKKFKGDYSEVDRCDVSYSIDTIRSIAQRFPEDQLFLIMGADAFNDFHLWKEPEEIVKLCALAVAQRPGSKLNLASHRFGEYARTFSIPQIDISSTDIRERINQRRSIQYLVPWTVQTFIEAKGLYK